VNSVNCSLRLYLVSWTPCDTIATGFSCSGNSRAPALPAAGPLALSATHGSLRPLAAEADRLHCIARPVVFGGSLSKGLRFARWWSVFAAHRQRHPLSVHQFHRGLHAQRCQPVLSPYRQQGCIQRKATPSSRPAAGRDVHCAARAWPAARSQ
jgi:hypothetical protein